MENVALKITSSAVLGGTIDEIGGGKFANGAITGAYGMLFNDLRHVARPKRRVDLKSGNVVNPLLDWFKYMESVDFVNPDNGNVFYTADIIDPESALKDSDLANAWDDFINGAMNGTPSVNGYGVTSDGRSVKWTIIDKYFGNLDHYKSNRLDQLNNSRVKDNYYKITVGVYHEAKIILNIYSKSLYENYCKYLGLSY